jgi:hypothetical protein
MGDWESSEVKQLQGLGKELQCCCCFCSEGVTMKEAVTLVIHSPEIEDDDVPQAVYAHRSCLKKALHPVVAFHVNAIS